MPPDPEVKTASILSASAEALDKLIQSKDERVLLLLPQNPNFTEKHAVVLLERPEIQGSVIAAFADAKGWLTRESIRLKIAKHPHSPKRIVLTVLRQMFLFNLVAISLMPSISGDIRRAAEELVLARIPHLATGEKLSLARRAPARIAAAILAEGHPQTMKLAMTNRFLTESQILKILAKDSVLRCVVEAIARDEKWSAYYNVRVALLRNVQTPSVCVQKFLNDLTGRELQHLAELCAIPEPVRGAIAAEIERRAIRPNRTSDGKTSSAA